jgi:hypothetical protein
MRFRGVKYRRLAEYSIEEKTALAKLLGYLFGDGSISRNKDGRYECSLSFALDEKEFVEDIKKITELLFHFAPKIKIENKNCFRILLRRSVARYLHRECRYPIGKKSVVNPRAPAWIMESESEVKASFVKWFLNAEASITDESIKIRQATRIFPPRDVINRLRQAARIRVASRYSYYSLSWRIGKSLCKPYIRPSNILIDFQELLRRFQVMGKIYSYWIWISQTSDDVSIHYELNLSKRQAERLINLISL